LVPFNSLKRRGGETARRRNSANRFKCFDWLDRLFLLNGRLLKLNQRQGEKAKLR
jgi:hypothetical protein